MTSTDSNCQVKKNVYDKNDFQRSHFPIHSFPLIPRQLTEYSKLPSNVVNSLKACKLYNSSQGCLKPSCLNDINGKTNVGDSAKGSKKTLVCKSLTATSLWITNPTTSFIVSSPKSTGERQILTEAQKTLTMTVTTLPTSQGVATTVNGMPNELLPITSSIFTST